MIRKWLTYELNSLRRLIHGEWWHRHTIEKHPINDGGNRTTIQHWDGNLVIYPSSRPIYYPAKKQSNPKTLHHSKFEHSSPSSSAMGLLSWWKPSQKPTSETKKPDPKPGSPPEIPGMNGAVEVPRPQATPDVTVFEFGSVAASSDKVTLAGYCPVSDDLEPCRWEILPASGSDAPQFRVVFWRKKERDCKELPN